MTVTLDRSYWTGNITLSSSSKCAGQELFDEAEKYKLRGYEIIPDRHGYDLRIPFWNGGMKIKLRRARGQLENRLDTKLKDGDIISFGGFGK